MAEPSCLPVRGVLLALDISKKVIGIAISDEDQLLASPLHTLKRTRWSDDLAAIQELCEERQVAGIVVGLPLNMDGSSGPAAQSRRDLADLIARALPAIPVKLQDERLTTQAVADAFEEGRWRRPKAGSAVDHYAAAIILEDAMRSTAYGSNAQGNLG